VEDKPGAVALNPSLGYAVVQCTGAHGRERVVVAEGLLRDTPDRWGAECAAGGIREARNYPSGGACAGHVPGFRPLAFC
jgi:hypothetical protein